MEIFPYKTALEREFLENVVLQIKKHEEEAKSRLFLEAEKLAKAFPGSELLNAEKYKQYLMVLFEAQRSGHSVHEEITQALEQYKKELGI